MCLSLFSPILLGRFLTLSLALSAILLSLIKRNFSFLIFLHFIERHLKFNFRLLGRFNENFS